MFRRILGAALAGVIALALLPAGAFANSPYDALRLHVIANSDSPEDQAVKLMVRDAVLELQREADTATREEAEAFVMENGEAFLQRAEAVLREQGFDYGVQLYYGVYRFPLRTYGSEVYPEGEYEALRIVLGEGGGANWWCVMFPPLCILELPGGKVDYDAADTFKLGDYEFSSLAVKLIKMIDGGKLWKRITSR